MVMSTILYAMNATTADQMNAVATAWNWIQSWLAIDYGSDDILFAT